MPIRKPIRAKNPGNPSTFNIFLISNAGGGFASNVRVSDGQTVGEIFNSKVGGRANDFMIRLNGSITPVDEPLAPDDRMVVTPTNVKGA